jgi:hypothetical protein
VVTAVNPYISFNAPLTLDQLLADFVTATGYNTVLNIGTPPSSGNALRAETIFVPRPGPPFNGPPIHDNGGLTLEHHGYVNASTTGGANNVYEEQPPLTAHPTLSGCTPPAGLP